jgi:hypothetical protein
MVVQKRRSPVGASSCRGGQNSDMLEFGAKEVLQTVPKRHRKPCQRGTANRAKEAPQTVSKEAPQTMLKEAPQTVPTVGKHVMGV